MKTHLHPMISSILISGGPLTGCLPSLEKPTFTTDTMDTAALTGTQTSTSSLPTTSGSTTTPVTDADGDGFSSANGDCDDADPAIHPGADALLLVNDYDCDGNQDSESSLTFSDYSFVGEAGDSRAGYGISSCGDVEGDGLGDIIISASGADDKGTYSGKACLILGRSLDERRALDLSNADYTFVGESEFNYAGVTVSDAGDVDGDGLGDIIIGARGHDDYTGKTYLILGSDLGETDSFSLSSVDYSFVGESGYDSADLRVSDAGDVDGDGLGDILIGAHNMDESARDSGKAYLFLGGNLRETGSRNLSNADYGFVGENGDDYAGYNLSSAGDVDGDGLADLLIGAQGNDDNGNYAGKVYLILADSLSEPGTSDLSVADYAFSGEADLNYAGYGLSDAGDIDGDGLADILIGAYGNDSGATDAGKVHLILGSSLVKLGSNNLFYADYGFIGENEGDDVGVSVSNAGDVDGDSLNDILIGAHFSEDGHPDAGKSYLILASSLGEPGTIALSDADYRFDGENGGDFAGRTLSDAGDVNGDGLGDILIGAYLNDERGTYSGKAYLLLSHL